MCGIAGIYNYNREPVSANLLQRMTDVVAHRGPDGEGHYTDGPLGLGHRRLAIIDLTPAAHQPMGNEDGSVVIVYNGELYNFQKLRVTLEGAGHRFHSRSDTEVILHAYEEWGEGCLDRFNGHFAFAIWDSRKERLFLARDRYGVKPLYYYFDGKAFVFASEVKSILVHPRVRRAVSYAALNEYFTFQNVLSDLTLFEGIRMLSAGSYLVVDAHVGKPSQHQYWDFRFSPEPLEISEAEAAEELYRLFAQAVNRQLMSDVPVGAYLSGGMDSASITAVARRQIGRLRTFTCGFDLSSASGLELAFDERARAEVLANLFKTEHYEVVLHAGDMEHIMPELIWHLEDLRVGQCYPNYYVARLAGKFVKVVLAGTGGDELFAGYPWRYQAGMKDCGSDTFYHTYYGFWQRLTPDQAKDKLFNASTFRHTREHETFDVFRGMVSSSGFSPHTAEACVNAALYFELKTFLHGLLVLEDKLSMAHGLESRVPFLDNDLVEFALKLPVGYKLRALAGGAQEIDENEGTQERRHALQTRDGKVILRQAMNRLIPSEVTERVKQGFSAPDASWFRGESIDYINTLLRNPRARLYDFINPAYVLQRLDEHTSGRQNHRLLIWSLLSFEWWLRRFLEGSA